MAVNRIIPFIDVDHRIHFFYHVFVLGIMIDSASAGKTGLRNSLAFSGHTPQNTIAYEDVNCKHFQPPRGDFRTFAGRFSA
jgi:hypothetical protein